MADPLDLITTGDCTARLAAGGFVLNLAQTAVLGPMVTAASREIQTELHRIIPAVDYDEILTPTRGRADRGEAPQVRLSHYPVNSSDTERIGFARTAALLVANTDPATNQFARVAFVTTGDPTLQLTYTGLKLQRRASGVTTPDEIDWPMTSPFMTLDALATAIIAKGGGWTATVTGGSTPAFGLFATTELVGAREAKPAFGTGAALDVFAQDVPEYSIDRASGIVSLGTLGGAGGFFGGTFGGFPGTSWGDADDDDLGGGASGYGQVRCTYNAGYATIPAEYQEFAAEVVKAMYERLKTDTSLKSETADGYTWVARDVLQGTALASILTGLQKYKDHRL